jgi:hypothetical protein
MSTCNQHRLWPLPSTSPPPSQTSRSASHPPDFPPVSVHNPVVPVKGQPIAQQVEQACLGGVVLGPAPAGSSRMRQ